MRLRRDPVYEPREIRYPEAKLAYGRTFHQRDEFQSRRIVHPAPELQDKPLDRLDDEPLSTSATVQGPWDSVPWSGNDDTNGSVPRTTAGADHDHRRDAGGSTLDLFV